MAKPGICVWGRGSMGGEERSMGGASSGARVGAPVGLGGLIPLSEGIWGLNPQWVTRGEAKPPKFE